MASSHQESRPPKTFIKSTLTLSKRFVEVYFYLNPEIVAETTLFKKHILYTYNFLQYLILENINKMLKREDHETSQKLISFICVNNTLLFVH